MLLFPFSNNAVIICFLFLEIFLLCYTHVSLLIQFQVFSESVYKMEIYYFPWYSFCVTILKVIVSKTNRMRLRFATNEEGRFEGFRLSYTTSVTPSECPRNVFVNGVTTYLYMA